MPKKRRLCGTMAAHMRLLEEYAPFRGRQRRLERDVVTVRGAPHQGRVVRPLVRRGDEDREEAGGDPALAHARQVELSVLAPVAQRTAVAPDPEQRVVVAVDDGNHSSSPGRSEYIAQSTRLPRGALQ